MAAKVAKGSLQEDLSRPEVLAKLETDPKSTFELAFSNAHKAIEAAFTKYYEESGWLVVRAPDGYLLRSKNRTTQPLCVHGGTTASVVVILKGRRLLVSNVGDSTAILCGLGEAGVLHSVDEWQPLHSGVPVPSASGPGGAASAPSGSPSVSAATDTATTSSYMEISADHSPESETEFARMHRCRPHSTLKNHPELLFVYDTLTASKLSCPPIFEVNPHTGQCAKTERGSYYKNVRCEWATLVATPPYADFQDALAFTRSLGDLHLQSYGVSHVPETWWMDLTIANELPPSAVSAAAAGAGASSTQPIGSGSSSPAAIAGEAVGSAGSGSSAGDHLDFPMLHMSPPSPFIGHGGTGSSLSSSSSVPGPLSESPLLGHPIVLCLCSDGVWDNWKFEDVASFLMHPDRVSNVVKTKRCDTAVTELMASNLDRARANFGSSADNMTAISEYRDYCECSNV